MYVFILRYKIYSGNIWSEGLRSGRDLEIEIIKKIIKTLYFEYNQTRTKILE